MKTIRLLSLLLSILCIHGKLLAQESPDLEVTGKVITKDGDSDQWNQAYSWGDHSSMGYLKLAGLAGFLEFTTSTTWVCPPNITSALIEVWGAGGGGGGGGLPGGNVTCGEPFPGTAGGGSSGGGSGASGPYVKHIISLIPGETYTITIGAGGTGGAVGQNGGRGELTSIIGPGLTVNVNGSWGGAKGNSGCGVSGGSYGIPATPTVNGAINRYGISGQYGPTSSSGTGGGGTCGCGMLEAISVATGSRSVRGSVEIYPSVSNGGNGGHGAYNTTDGSDSFAATAGSPGKRGNVIMMLFAGN